MNVLDLFSGIGGFSLGLERAGMRTIAFCEIDPYCRRVLRRHWPDVPIYGDIRELTAARLVADAKSKPSRVAALQGSQERSGQSGDKQFSSDCGVDVICGGFPCQDISVAGKGAGIGGERSGLWSEYARIIGEVRPRYVIVENVAALLGRGLTTILRDLAALRFDAEWHCIPASAVGAPHRRDRVWIVAYPNRQSLRGGGYPGDAGSPGCLQGEAEQRERLWADAATGGSCADVADAEGDRRDEGREDCNGFRIGTGGDRFGQSLGAGPAIPNADSAGRGEQWRGIPIREELAAAQCGDWWLAEPAVGELVDGLSSGLVRFEGRVARNIPDRVNKLRALGNAVVPQIPELIGRAIMSYDNWKTTNPADEWLGPEPDDYDGNDDFAKSYNECLRVIRERKAAGGKGWEPP